MTLVSGQRLGPYEILELIGKGGMGEVYRARDTRLDRIVAIKTSSEQFTARFEQEARAVAALNHSNICTLHDVGPNYLVLEYIEGTPLKGPLPLDQVQRYAMQICDALDAAHRKGITHRDLKPGNILVTKTGIKLLDFGLARMDSRRAPTGDSVTIAATDPGTVMGTFQYMSPEQLEGGEADARSDIFALGAVLFEMVTGRKAFQGKSQASLISAIMIGQTQSMAELVPLSPPPLDRVVQTCLAKDPDERWQNSRDVKHALKSALEPQGNAIPVSHRRVWPYWAAITASIVAAATLGLVHFREIPPQLETLQFEVDRPRGSGEPAMALSPDGRRIVTIAGREGLWVRDLNSLEWHVLPGTDNARYPFWSYDGADIGFFAKGELKRIPAAGGIPRRLATASDGRGGTWNREGVILYAPSPTGAIWKVQAQGGPAPAAITQPPGGDLGDRFPQFLPDGEHFFFSRGVSGNPDAAGLFLASLDGKPAVRVLPLETNAVFLPGAASKAMGHLIFMQGGTLMAQRFDFEQVKLFDGAVPVKQGLSMLNTAAGAFSLSRDGKLATIVPRPRSPELVSVDLKGNVHETIVKLDTSSNEGAFFTLTRSALSSRQNRLAYSIASTNNSEVWIRDLISGTSFPLTKSPGATYAIWSFDDTEIIFCAATPGGFGIFRKASNGTDMEELLVKTSVNARVWDWSRDGKFLVYSQQDPTTGIDLWLLPMEPGPDGTRKPEAYLHGPAREDGARFAPSSDGAPHFIAYTTNESGRVEVWVQRVPITGEKWRIAEGSNPRWAQNGKELFFTVSREGKRSLMRAKVRIGTSFEASYAEQMFELPARADLAFYPSLDGQRFIFAARGEGEAGAPPITIMTHWSAMLKD